MGYDVSLDHLSRDTVDDPEADPCSLKKLLSDRGCIDDSHRKGVHSINSAKKAEYPQGKNKSRTQSHNTCENHFDRD